jgi:hypothetical protein
MAFIEVLDPTASPRVSELPLAARRGSLAGKKIGFLSNGKANAELLLDDIGELLRSRLDGLTVVKGDKGAAEPAPDDVMERLRACDAVITAIAD